MFSLPSALVAPSFVEKWPCHLSVGVSTSVKLIKVLYVLDVRDIPRKIPIDYVHMAINVLNLNLKVFFTLYNGMSLPYSACDALFKQGQKI